MDNFDNEIKRILSSDIQLSNKYKNTIRNTLKEAKQKNNKKTKIVKVLASCCACVTITSSIVFAKDISNIISGFFNNSQGIDTAIQNGYIEKPNMEYVSSKNTKMKVDNILMDDFNLSFTLNVVCSKEFKVTNFARLDLSKIIITDDEKRILYCNDEDIFKNYCEKNNLEYSYENFDSHHINSGLNSYIKDIDTDNNTLSLVYNLFADKYPKSKRLNIAISQIDLAKENSDKKIAMNGKWNCKVQIPEKFYNREEIIYKVKSCSNPKLNVTSAVVYNTCMKLNLNTLEDKIYDENDSEEVISQKISKENEKYRKSVLDAWEKGKDKWEKEKNLDDVGLFNRRPYVENSKGKKFYPTESSSEDGGWSNDLMNGIVKYWQTFNLTRYDATDNLKVHLKYKQQDIVIELER